MRGFAWPWHYQRKELPGPGSQNIAFLTLALERETPIGPGLANQRQFGFQTPATLVPHVIGLQGIGGLLHGQIYQAPLIVRAQ